MRITTRTAIIIMNMSMVMPITIMTTAMGIRTSATITASRIRITDTIIMITRPMRSISALGRRAFTSPG